MVSRLPSPFLLLLPLAVAAAPPPQELEADRFVPPPVGAVAPPLGEVRWYQLEAPGRAPDIAAMRGEVVLVHTWGYYCGPCMREGVPYVVDLLGANRERGLRAVSLTCQVGDGMPDDHFVKVGREKGMHHALGMAGAFGELSPYLNMNHNKGLTWCFVIERSGGVAWAGDPSIDSEEFLEAVARALEEPAPPALATSYAEALHKAVAHYVARDFESAREEAQRVRDKESRARDGSDTVIADCDSLTALIDQHLVALEQELHEALEKRDAHAFLAARRGLLAHFPKSEAAKKVRALEKTAHADAELSHALELEQAWEELRLERPVLFPSRADKDAKRYAKKLEKYVERAEPGAPGLDQAKRWLSTFAALEG